MLLVVNVDKAFLVYPTGLVCKCIHKYGNTVFLGKYNVMVDISGAVRALSQGSVIASALGESFKPSSVLFIDAGNGVSAADCMEALKKSPSFAEKTFTDTM